MFKRNFSLNLRIEKNVLKSFGICMRTGELPLNKRYTTLRDANDVRISAMPAIAVWRREGRLSLCLVVNAAVWPDPVRSGSGCSPGHSSVFAIFKWMFEFFSNHWREKILCGGRCACLNFLSRICAKRHPTAFSPTVKKSANGVICSFVVDV